jgi:hypothetical protein
MKKKSMRTSETTERFHFVISITGLIRPNTGKVDDHKKQIYLLLKAFTVLYLKS